MIVIIKGDNISVTLLSLAPIFIVWFVLEGSFVHEQQIQLRTSSTNNQNGQRNGKHEEEGILLEAVIGGEVHNHAGEHDDHCGGLGC